MITKEQLRILTVFSKDIFAELTFKLIKEKSRQKSNNVVQIAIKEFQKHGLLNIKKVGDIIVYSLNLRNNLTLACLNIINEEELNKRNIPKKLLRDIQERIAKHTEFFILLVFGSYAKNTATDKSDLDIAVIVDSENIKKEITPSIQTIKRREIINIDYHIFTRQEFLDMLNTDYENLGKQIAKNHVIYYGFIGYWNLIRGDKNER